MSSSDTRRRAHRYRRTANIFASIIMSAGLVMALLGIYGAWQGWRTLSWPTAPAEIISSALEEDTATRTVPMTDKHRGGSKITSTTSQLDVLYRYGVNGVGYEGRGIEPWDFGIQNSAKVRALHLNQAPGSVISAAYDPREPRRSYLLPGPSSTSLTLAGVGLGLIALGFVLGRIGRRV